MIILILAILDPSVNEIPYCTGKLISTSCLAAGCSCCKGVWHTYTLDQVPEVPKLISCQRFNVAVAACSLKVPVRIPVYTVFLKSKVPQKDPKKKFIGHLPVALENKAQNQKSAPWCLLSSFNRAIDSYIRVRNSGNWSKSKGCFRTNSGLCFPLVRTVPYRYRYRYHTGRRSY